MARYTFKNLAAFAEQKNWSTIFAGKNTRTS